MWYEIVTWFSHGIPLLVIQKYCLFFQVFEAKRNVLRIANINVQNNNGIWNQYNRVKGFERIGCVSNRRTTFCCVVSYPKLALLPRELLSIVISYASFRIVKVFFIVRTKPQLQTYALKNELNVLKHSEIAYCDPVNVSCIHYPWDIFCIMTHSSSVDWTQSELG